MDLSVAYNCPVTGRYYDARRVRKQLLASGPVNDWIAEEPRSDASEELLLSAARQAFSLSPVEPVTGQGFTDEVALLVLDAFTEYLAGKVGTAQTSPISAPCTGC